MTERLTHTQWNKWKYLLVGKSIVCVNRTISERESCWVAPFWQFELLLWSISSGFPLANPFGLPESQSIFGVSQDPPMSSYTTLSQDELHHKGLWVEHPLTSLSFWSLRSFPEHVYLGRSPDLENEKYVVWVGPNFNCPAIFVLEFWSIGNELPITLPLGASSTACLKMRMKDQQGYVCQAKGAELYSVECGLSQIAFGKKYHWSK